MSYYAYDAREPDGYLGDAASISGWSKFAAWAETAGGEIAKLASEGYSEDPATLAKELAAAKADDVDAESVRANLADLAAKAQDCFIVSDNC
jgi:hypothetical protein